MALDFGKLGFGFLSLPLVAPNDSNSIDLETTKKMVDLFLRKGFRYFDTVFTYLNGKSEVLEIQVKCTQHWCNRQNNIHHYSNMRCLNSLNRLWA